MILEKSDESIVMIVSVATISSASLRKNKRTGVVTLRSQPLQTNKWVNAAIQFTAPDTSRRAETSAAPWKEESTIELYIDNILHATSQEQFGRYFHVCTIV